MGFSESPSLGFRQLESDPFILGERDLQERSGLGDRVCSCCGQTAGNGPTILTELASPVLLSAGPRATFPSTLSSHSAPAGDFVLTAFNCECGTKEGGQRHTKGKKAMALLSKNYTHRPASWLQSTGCWIPRLRPMSYGNSTNTAARRAAVHGASMWYGAPSVMEIETRRKQNHLLSAP